MSDTEADLPADEERRDNDTTDRDRIATLARYWRRTARNLYIGVGLVAGGLGILLLGLFLLLGRIQDSREASTSESCMATWRANSGIHEFILGPPLPGRPAPPAKGTPLGDALRARLDEKFPLIAPTEKQAEMRCAERARARTALDP